jgi:hypothetical protein
MTEAEGPCQKCDSPISTDAARCPACGYEPGAEIRKQARWRWGIGALCCLTIIGGIIGIPLVISGFLHHRKAKSATPVHSD